MKLTRATKNLKHNFKSEEESAAYHEKRRQDLAKKIEAEKKLKDNLIFLPKDSKDHKSIEGMLKKYGIEATEKDVEKAEVGRHKRRISRGRNSNSYSKRPQFEQSRPNHSLLLKAGWNDLTSINQLLGE